MTIDEEIKKLCAEIKPETLKAYAESKGWVLSRKIDDYDLYFNDYWEYGIFIPFDDETLTTLSEFEGRPAIAVLYDLWKIQNQDARIKEIEGLLEHKSLDAYIEEVMAEMRNSGNSSCPPGHPDCSDYCPTCWEPYLKKIVGGFRDKRIAELEIHLGAVLDLESCMKGGDFIQLWKKPFNEATKCMQGMTPIKDKYEEGLKKKIADLEAEVRRLEDGQG